MANCFLHRPASTRGRLTLGLAALSLAVTASVSAQQAGFGTELYKRDPWTVRLDVSSDPNGTAIEQSGDVIRLRTRAGAIIWRAKDRVAGAFTVRATIQLPAETAPGGAGLFFGGYDLEGINRNYAACLVRADGSWSITHRNGVELHDFRAWTRADVVSTAMREGRTTNVVEWVVGVERVGCRINGTEMYSFPRARSLVVPGGLRTIDGDVGLRVDAGLAASFTGFEVVTAAGPASPP